MKTPLQEMVPKGLPSLKDVAEKIRRHMKDSHVGPLHVADLLVDLESRWADYADQAGGLTATEWASDALGSQGALAAARRRHQALGKLEQLGYSRGYLKARLHHEMVVWLAGPSISDADRQEAVKQVCDETSARGGLPLSPAIARSVVSCKRRSAARTGSRKIIVLLKHVELLESTLRSAGLKIPRRPAEIDV